MELERRDSAVAMEFREAQEEREAVAGRVAGGCLAEIFGNRALARAAVADRQVLEALALPSRSARVRLARLAQLAQETHFRC